MKWLSDEAVERLRAAADAPDLSGTRYGLIERLGGGGMGSVYLANDATLGRRVALKVLHGPGDLDESGELARRMIREAQVLARLEHPGIVPIYDAGTLADERVFYTMKYVQGRRLDQYLDQNPALQERLRIFGKICEAVAFAHAHGVLHRDLKPQNIMIGPFGEVLVMDWGVAKILDTLPASEANTNLALHSRGVEEAKKNEKIFAEDGELTPSARVNAETAQERSEYAEETAKSSPEENSAPGATDHGVVLGTPGYMAPEQERGEISLHDKRTDVYALGAILLFLVAGQAGGAKETHTRPEKVKIPSALRAIERKAMSTNPAERYADAEELAQEIDRFLDGLPVAAYPESLFVKVGRLARRHRAAVALVLAYLLMRIAFIFWFKR